MSTYAPRYTTSNQFEHEKYLLRKQVFKLFGGSFRIYDDTGNLSFFASMKAFRLREDISVYTGEDKTTELLRIKARQIIDWSVAFDVVDSANGEKVGALKRRGWKSMLRDEWVIMDAVDQEIGTIREDSMLRAVLRRVIGNLVTLIIPQGFHGEVGGTPVFVFKQHFNPFILKLDLDYSADIGRRLDRRLGIAAGILICAIEGRQK